MPPLSSEGRAALLVQARWRTEPPAPFASRATLFEECSRLSAGLFEQIQASLASAKVEGRLGLAPLLLVGCEAAKATDLARELRGCEQVERVEEVLADPESSRALFVPLVPPLLSSRVIAGFADIGQPDFESPLLRSPLVGPDEDFPFDSEGEEARGEHPTAVLASFLQALQPDRPPPCIFESVGRDRGPFAWLAALDRLLCRGAAVVNLSYGRLPLEREAGWAALEWGTELLCRMTGAVIVAAAGSLDPELRFGRRLYLPASAPHVLAADEAGRPDSDRARGEGEKVFLASRANPSEGRPGSSYSSARIAARVVDALRALPASARDYEAITAILLASARPHASDALSPGSPDRARLRCIAGSRSFLRGTGSRSLVLSVPAAVPLRVALVWRHAGDEPRLVAPSYRRLYRLRRAAQWLVMDVLPGDLPLQVVGANGPWTVAWARLDEEDLGCLFGSEACSAERSSRPAASLPPAATI